jgi:hypothetical protein
VKKEGTIGDSEREGSLVSMGCKELDMTEQLNINNKQWK